MYIICYIFKKNTCNRVIETLEANLGSKKRSRLVNWQEILKNNPELLRDLKACDPEIDFIEKDIHFLYQKLSSQIHGYWMGEADLTIPEKSVDLDTCLLETLYKFAMKKRIALDGVKIRERGFTAALRDWEESRMEYEEEEEEREEPLRRSG
jgi:hypothetical protein